MPSVTVYKGNTVEHDGVVYTEGETITDITEKQAKALVEAGVVRDDTAHEAPAQPSDEEVAKAADQAGGAPTV